MAPTTRASAKGHVFQTKSVKKVGRGKKPGNNKKSGVEQKKSDIKVAGCRLLELPPGRIPSDKIRNRIYHFAQETRFDSDGMGPPLLIKSTSATQPSGTPNTYSARKFFALTQTCKQIRSEYRPLWLRASSIRIEMENITSFVNAYYPKVEEYSNAPDLLLISWDHGHGEDDEVLFDITLLFHLRAHCKTFTTKFVSRRLVEGDLPNTDCLNCGHSIYCGCGTDCDHEEAFDEAWGDLHFQYYYLHALNEFLNNKNEAWLKAFREQVRKGIKIKFTYDLDTQQTTLYIRFVKGLAPALFKRVDMYKTAVRYLRHMGILDLEMHEELDFVVGEATGKYTRHSEDCHFAVPTYNQIQISGRVGKKAGASPQASSST
ncbi:Nn.00g010300.m01.CDS01 [Neocucurbitaria sp. VM-36]